ncbi:MAG: glycosyltransferase family 39 protein [Flavobacteriaceae bacterium]|nr:glycosyltransferase family 39 protein [Flavobacteriaceae bacterium]
MKKHWPTIAVLCLIKFVIHALANANYGYHRDELLHLSVSEHLSWGYFEFPPFIAFLGKLSSLFFDYSLWGTRLFPTLAGIAILIICCLTVIELGGKKKAVLLAGVCVLAFLPFYRNHTLFQPVAFDQLFWTLGFYFIIRFINSERKKYLVFVAVVLGIGILNKYTMLIWAFGVFIGLLFYNKGKLFKNKWLYISGGMAFLIVLPNLIWQIQHDFPLVQHVSALNENQLDDISPFDFLTDQFHLPITLVVSLMGLVAAFRDEQLKKYRSIAISAIAIFLTMWALRSKSYYIFAIYPVLFALGAVKIESLLQHKAKLIYALTGILFLLALPFIPMSTPILPIDQYVSIYKKDTQNGRVQLTGDYADMFGWKEQVELVDSVYKSLPEIERRNAVLWAENYGEAGALNIIGKKYDLPAPISRHGSFWFRGYGNKNADVWISIGNEQSSVNYVFEEVELVKVITHKYAIDEEVNIPLYICRKPKIDIEQWWLDYREHVFD